MSAEKYPPSLNRKEQTTESEISVHLYRTKSQHWLATCTAVSLGMPA